MPVFGIILVRIFLAFSRDTSISSSIQTKCRKMREKCGPEQLWIRTRFTQCLSYIWNPSFLRNPPTINIWHCSKYVSGLHSVTKVNDVSIKVRQTCFLRLRLLIFSENVWHMIFLVVLKHVLKTVLALVDSKRYCKGKTSSRVWACFFHFYFFRLLLNSIFLLESVF